jgi:predicted dienelactone hydrolase
VTKACGVAQGFSPASSLFAALKGCATFESCIAAMAIAAIAVARTTGTAAQPEASASFELPAPGGPYPVGTTSWRVTDASRTETFTTTGEPRQVEVLAWYPAAAPRRGNAVAPYLREGLAEVRAFAAVLRAPRAAFDGLDKVRTHADLDAAPRVTPRKLPVLLFAHGYTGLPSSHTALLEDLASYGYAVLSVVHPYEAAAATLADGRVVSMLTPAGTLLPPIAEVLGEWRAEEDAMAAVTKTNDDAEQRRLLREYLSGLTRTDAALRRWVDDTKLALDRLSAVPPRSAAARLVAALDTARVGAFGHSMGGVSAAQFCVEDPRCGAALNLDGIPQYGSMIDATMPRPFLMVYSARPGRLGASDAIYRRAARPYYRVDVPDTRHLDFCDMTFWGGPLRERPVLGTMAPARVTAITRAVVRRFFDQELLGQRAALFTALASFPEVTVKTVVPGTR